MFAAFLFPYRCAAERDIKEEEKMLADSFNYKLAAGLHRERLAEAASIRFAIKARKAEKEAKKRHSAVFTEVRLKYRIGRQLIAIGERMTA